MHLLKMIQYAEDLVYKAVDAVGDINSAHLWITNCLRRDTHQAPASGYIRYDMKPAGPTALPDCRLKDQRTVTGPFLSGGRTRRTGDTRGRRSSDGRAKAGGGSPRIHGL